MPQEDELVDQELHNGEFLELDDLLGPLHFDAPDAQVLPDMDLNSDITLSLALSVHSVSSAESVQGALNNNIVPFLELDLNVPAQDVYLVIEEQAIPPLQAHVPALENVAAVIVPPIEQPFINAAILAADLHDPVSQEVEYDSNMAAHSTPVLQEIAPSGHAVVEVSNIVASSSNVVAVQPTPVAQDYFCCSFCLGSVH